MKDTITLDYQQALQLEHSVKLAVLEALGYNYMEMSDNIVSRIDAVTQLEIDKLF